MILYGCWLMLCTVFLLDGQLLLAAIGGRSSAAARQQLLTLPLGFAMVTLLLTPVRLYVAAAWALAAVLQLVSHLLWRWSLRVAPAPAWLTAEVLALSADWSTPAPKRVLVGNFGPAVVGLGRPVLLVPPAFLALAEEDRRAIVAHELAHVAARDSLKLWLARVAGTLLCWHPLAVTSLASFRLTVELTADARAAAWLGDARQYALALGRWALAAGQAAGRGGAPGWGAALAERPSDLQIRLEALVDLDLPVGRAVRLPTVINRLFAARREYRLSAAPAAGLLGPAVIVATAVGYTALFLLLVWLT